MCDAAQSAGIEPTTPDGVSFQRVCSTGGRAMSPAMRGSLADHGPHQALARLLERHVVAEARRASSCTNDDDMNTTAPPAPASAGANVSSGVSTSRRLSRT